MSEITLLKSDLLFDVDFESNPKDLRGTKYSSKIPHIQYIPKSRICPSSFSLYNTEKYDALRKLVDESDLPKDVKKMLILASTRFIKFDYEKVAEFYSHQDKKVQELMEKLGLVIIDFDDALENGFIELSKNMEELYEVEK